MRSKLLSVAALCAMLITASGLSNAQARVVQAKVAMTDSSAAPLSTTKRVAIANVMVSFQASVGGDKTNTSGLFAAKSDASSSLQMPVMDTQLLSSIADDIHQQLKADLQANGFEVLPEATVVASQAYQKIIAMAGITNFSKFANMNGDVVLVGASGLKPYLPYNAETGKFGQPSRSLINDWISKMAGKSSTEGGPSSISIAEIYALPGLEVEMSKELNAHVVKATYVVTLGSTKSSVERFTGMHQDIRGNTGFSSTHTGSAFAQVGLLAGQSRIAFRTSAANTSGESSSGSYTANFGNSAAAAKDGNVVVTLAESLAGGTDFFSLSGGEKKDGGIGKFLFGKVLGGTGADTQFEFTASISDPATYRAEVVGMVKQAQRDMLVLVKQ
jgi:hypothetical protein